jgi:hypothetical protein
MVDEVPFFAIRVMKVLADRLRHKDGPSLPFVSQRPLLSPAIERETFTRCQSA